MVINHCNMFYCLWFLEGSQTPQWLTMNSALKGFISVVKTQQQIEAEHKKTHSYQNEEQ